MFASHGRQYKIGLVCVYADLSILTHLAWDSRISALKYLSRQRGSLAVVIVSLININNWPYLGINNFQLMNQIRTQA